MRVRVGAALTVALCLAGATHAPAVAVRRVRVAQMRVTEYHAAPAMPVAVAPTPTPTVLQPLQPYLRAFHRAAQQAHVPASLLEAVALTESGGNPSAVSSVGALSIMQVRPSTGHALGFWGLRSPVVSIEAGAAYLARLAHRYGVDAPCWAVSPGGSGACAWRVDEVLSGYAGGPGAWVPWYAQRVRRAWVAIEGVAA